MTREEALTVAAQRKAARGRRTSRIRKTVATLAVAAFIGPFAVIYTGVAAGKDAALAATSQPQSTTVAKSSSNGSAATATTNSATTNSATTTASTSSPAPVTTQQS